MATYTKLSSGSWRVQVRRKDRYVSETFLRRDDARCWATETERQVDRGETPTKSPLRHLGKCNLAALGRERLIRFGRDGAAQGAGFVSTEIGLEEEEMEISDEGDLIESRTPSFCR
ncbi:MULTISPECIES: hypothetical protein [unclassified Mesorhizobium]|uniref:hypothetical protein n=1 Tax=unclassified Mesorhizobium TaxID=325217 RepID=UPI0015E3E858|nr:MULTISPECIES: hypothetical protein [unclassified Mesorhizobium]